MINKINADLGLESRVIEYIFYFFERIPHFYRPFGDLKSAKYI